jgi:curved DNA-binding protein CbpA
MATANGSAYLRHLAVLGLKKPPTLKALKEARNALMKKAHPDAGGSNHAAALINEAYENLLKLVSAGSAGKGR